MKIFSLSEHLEEDNTRKSIDGVYRKKTDIIDLGSAATTFTLDHKITEKIINLHAADLAKSITQYPTISPDPHLERSLAKKFKEESGHVFDEAQFVVFRGVLGGGAFCTISLFKKGRYVILPENIYQYHKATFAHYGKDVVEAKVDENGLIDLNHLASLLKETKSDTAFVYFYSLYGKLPSKDYLEKLISLVRSSSTLLVYDSDVIFTSYAKDSENSLPKVDYNSLENIIILGNLTKEFGAPGIRISYGIADKKLAHDINKFQKETMEMISSLDRMLATSIVDRASISEIRKTLKERMHILVNGLNALGWKIKMPDTGINLFIDVPDSFTKSKRVRGSDLFYFYLVSKVGILSRPGCMHSSKEKNKIRLVISQPANGIADAIERMRRDSVNPSMRLPEGIEEEYLKLYQADKAAQDKLRIADKEALRLVELYKNYKKVDAELLSLEKKHPKSASKIDELKRKLDDISGEIRFQNPLIWMIFKDKRGMMANRPEERIANFGEFKNHCKNEKFTCNRRIMFFNHYLKKKNIDLFDRKEFSDGMKLKDFYSKSDIINATKDQKLVDEWKKYEFYELSNKPAKWKNFPEKKFMS